MTNMDVLDFRADDQAPSPAAPRLRLFRPAHPAIALGLAVSHLMTKPAFAHEEFGSWSRVLVGQVNRGHSAAIGAHPERWCRANSSM
jgi:hypothetical protein